jgi:hypothetical protein
VPSSAVAPPMSPTVHGASHGAAFVAPPPLPATTGPRAGPQDTPSRDGAAVDTCFCPGTCICVGPSRAPLVMYRPDLCLKVCCVSLR